MFSNRGYISRNGAKHEIYDNSSVSKRTNYNHIPDRKTTAKRVETKLILWILTGTGVLSYIGAIILNVGTWKADVLFFIAILFGIVKFVRYSIKTWQDYRRGELEIKAMKKKQDEKIFL